MSDPTLRASGVVCRECGADVVLREPRPGGKRFHPFYGCSRYPRCTHTLSVEEVDMRVSGDYGDDWPDPDWGVR